MTFGFNFGFNARRQTAAAAAAAAPTPPTFFLAANCTLHSKAALANATISDTDKVDAWVNDGTANTDWAGTLIARPAYSATGLGGDKPGLTFDGSNDQLTNALRANQVLGTAAIGTVACVVVVNTLPGAGATRDILLVPDQGYGSMSVRNTAGQGSIRMQRYGSTDVAVNISAGTKYLAVWRCPAAGGGATHKLSLNGGAENTQTNNGDPGGQTNTLICGGSGGNNGFAACTISEIWIAPTECTAQDIADLYTYAKSEWGVP